MAVLVTEKYKGRRLDAGSAEVIYHVEGTDADAGTISDQDAFEAVLNSVPGDWYGIPAANIDVRAELVQDTIWEVAVLYSITDPVIYQQSSVAYEFSFQAPQEKVYQSLLTRGCYSEDGPLNANKFGGAINVVNNNGEQTVEGLDLPAGSPTNTWIYNALNATVTDTYQQAVESVMGAVSNTMFKLRAGLTMRLVGCDGGAIFSFGTAARWTIRFAFQFRKNRTNVTFGGIQVPFIGGHDLVWGYYSDTFDEEGAPENHELVKRPKYILVEQVFPEVNMNVLGI